MVTLSEENYLKTIYHLRKQDEDYVSTNSIAEKIETKNQADSLCYQTTKQLEELESKIDASEKEKVESLLTKLQAAINTDDTDAMKSLTEEIKQIMMELGQKVYSQTDSTPSTDSDSETIETDFNECVSLFFSFLYFKN